MKNDRFNKELLPGIYFYFIEDRMDWVPSFITLIGPPSLRLKLILTHLLVHLYTA